LLREFQDISGIRITDLQIITALFNYPQKPYLLPSVGLGADPGVQAVNPQVTISHPPRLPLLSARPEVTFTAAEHHRPLADTKLYCLATEAHRLLHSICPK